MIAVNLLPWRQARLQRQRRISIAFAMTALMALLLIMAFQLRRLDGASQQLRAAQTEVRDALAAIERRLRQRHLLQQQLTSQQAQRRQAQQHADALMRWHRFWQALPALLPDSLWLQRMEKLSAQLRVEGQAQDMQAIRDFRQRLEALALFKAVMQGSVQRQPHGLYRFALRAQLSEPGDE